jgi:hypothetical protein
MAEWREIDEQSPAFGAFAYSGRIDLRPRHTVWKFRDGIGE